MLTKIDIKIIEEIFDRKFDQKFDEKFDEKFDKAFDRKFDQKFDEVTDTFEGIVAKFKDEVITAIDKNTGELKAMREELTAISGKTSEHSDTLENHEGRIKKMERTTIC